MSTASPPPLDVDSKSGSHLWREVDPDGRDLVFKHESPATDWLLQATEDTGRVGRLFEAGVFERMPPSVDSTIERVDPTDDGWTVVMRDATPALLAVEGALTRATSRRLLEGVAALHAAFRGELLPDGLCTLANRYGFLAPDRARSLVDLHVVPRLVVQGWERFAEVVPADVADAILALAADSASLLDALAQRPATLLHGDLKLSNFGLDDDHVVLIDWGSFTGLGPPVCEYAWYVSMNASRIDASHDELLDDIRAVEGDHHDEYALRLALVGSLVQFGWEKALGATADDEATRTREQADLRWWVGQARAGLDT